MKICPNCGAHMSADTKFCTNCGYDLTNVPVAGTEMQATNSYWNWLVQSWSRPSEVMENIPSWYSWVTLAVTFVASSLGMYFGINGLVAKQVNLVSGNMGGMMHGITNKIEQMTVNFSSTAAFEYFMLLIIAFFFAFILVHLLHPEMNLHIFTDRIATGANYALPAALLTLLLGRTSLAVLLILTFGVVNIVFASVMAQIFNHEEAKHDKLLFGIIFLVGMLLVFLLMLSFVKTGLTSSILGYMPRGGQI